MQVLAHTILTQITCWLSFYTLMVLLLVIQPLLCQSFTVLVTIVPIYSSKSFLVNTCHIIFLKHARKKFSAMNLLYRRQSLVEVVS